MKRFLWILLVLLMLFPASALAAGLPADGEYTIEAALSGGSGRASVESPAKLVVKDGVCTATVIWSSPFYEYMRIGDTAYDPVQTEGNAVFEIPAVLDQDMEVSALTVAMSEPHEIEYTLRFDSSTIRPAGGGNAAVYIVIGCAVSAAVIAAVIVVTRRKSRGGAK